MRGYSQEQLAGSADPLVGLGAYDRLHPALHHLRRADRDDARRPQGRGRPSRAAFRATADGDALEAVGMQPVPPPLSAARRRLSAQASSRFEPRVDAPDELRDPLEVRALGAVDTPSTAPQAHPRAVAETARRRAHRKPAPWQTMILGQVVAATGGHTNRTGAGRKTTYRRKAVTKATRRTSPQLGAFEPRASRR